MENLDARFLKGFGAHTRAARRGGDELDALLNHEINNIGTLDVRQGHIHAKGLVGQIAHFCDLVTNIVELTRGGFDNPHAASITHG